MSFNGHQKMGFLTNIKILFSFLSIEGNRFIDKKNQPRDMQKGASQDNTEEATNKKKQNKGKRMALHSHLQSFLTETSFP